jgi:hypothetical protein
MKAWFLPASIPTLTWIIIALNSTVLILLYLKDPNEDIRRTIHRMHPNLYMLLKMCYTILMISLALNVRFVVQKAIVDPGSSYIQKRLMAAMPSVPSMLRRFSRR